MDRSTPGLRLEAITPPRQKIMPIWRTICPVDRSFIQGIIEDVVMLTETPVDWIFLRTAAELWDPQHAVFNFQGTELAPTIEDQLSTLLGIPVQEVHQELHQGWDHDIRITWLLDWTLLRALTPSTGSYQRDACHGFLLLIFGTLLFPYAPNLIDRAIAQVVLQAVGGHSYVGALLAETVRSLDYVREGPTSPQRPQTVPILRAAPAVAPEVESSTQAAMHAELHSIREERDRLRCELVYSRAEVANYRELQTELARARARITALDLEIARLSATASSSTGTTAKSHWSTTGLSGGTFGIPTAFDFNHYTHITLGVFGSPADIRTTFAADSTTSPRRHPRHRARRQYRNASRPKSSVIKFQIVTSAANMAEMMALLRGPNRASSNSTPPFAHESTVDPTPWALSTFAPGDDIAPAPTTPAQVSTVHPADLFQPQPTIPAVAPLPSPIRAHPGYGLYYTPTNSPPYVKCPRSSPFQSTETFPFLTLQSHGGLPYQFPPTLNIPPLEPCTPSHVDPVAPPTTFLSEAETEQERRMRRIEETIRALQASETRPDNNYGDCSLFPSMRLPSKVKISEFKTYEGMIDPRHHLRHYRGKMLQYWNYEEFIIHSFQDSLKGSALD
ncbi:hypothetical protein CRG98_015288 [Punica granatum]|uniref:Aminotransferase-like plant mobile domain-containing protein n=1 Tax=Punica granatum TaxID=22663 RepID=A0A2I0K873_PUNGR|nr:hypothetical protein CRG98_015288 [Punica granatum]